jgi:hypothetical protein
MMKEKQISIEGQRCISQCINKYWSHLDVDTKDDIRNQKYEQCLTSCNICG